MPRVSIKEEVKVADNIIEVKEKTYIIPQKIMRDGIVFEYDSDLEYYISNIDFITISAKNYIKECLNNEKKANETHDQESLIRKMITDLDKMFPGMSEESKNAMFKDYCDFDLEAIKQKHGIPSIYDKEQKNTTNTDKEV